MTQSGQELPNNPNAEAGVLSAMLIDKVAVVKATKALSESDFWKKAHKLIFRAIINLWSNDTDIDLITLQDRLKQEGTFDRVGGFEFLMQLQGVVISGSSVDNHIEIVSDLSKRRKLAVLSDNTLHLIHTEKTTADIHQNILETLININGVELVTTYPTGLDFLDYGVNMSVGHLVILASRPSFGKSALATQIAFNWASLYGLNVMIFSLEMDKEEVAIRIISQCGEINEKDITTHRMNEYALSRFVAMGDTIKECKITVNENSSISLPLIQDGVTRQTVEHEKPDAIIIDYLQLMSGNKRSTNRQEEVSEMSRGLKKLAKSEKMLVLALAQLNRGCESRDNKRPLLSDLRESGGIEQDADTVMFLYRDVMYHKDKANDNDAELLVRKNRHGKIYTSHMTFYPEITRFADKKWYPKED